MLERDILIDGEVWHTHELTLATLIPGQEIVVTVRSRDGEAAIETSHSLPWADGMGLADMEEAVWALPEFEEWTDTAAGLDEVLAILTDEQAETVTTLFPKWKVGVNYVRGFRVQYDEKLYRCEQAHTSEEGWPPDKTTALWTRVAKEGEIPEWVQPTGAQDAYDKGDKVRHNGKVWVSTYDGKNVWEPSVYGWDEVTE